MKLWRYGRSIEQLAQRYRLEGSLGSGGMADVCLAWDERDQREVAIKVIRPDTLDQRTLDRFTKEAAQVAQWHHPHILRVYSALKLELLDASQGAIVPYIVMEYAQGGDLQKRLTSGQPYPLAKTLEIFSQLCSAVAYAHTQGIIHRDLKPLNILFRSLPTEPDEVVLSDFGLAVEMSATHHTFARGGTLPYMAPEQLQGHVEAASDIFALGVILYQLCTGRLPFRRSLQDLRRPDAFASPTLPSIIAPNLPPALDDVILTALAAQPADRYASASQFWDAVQAAIASLQNSTRLRGVGSKQTGPHGEPGEHGLIPLRSIAPLQRRTQGTNSSQYASNNNIGTQGANPSKHDTINGRGAMQQSGKGANPSKHDTINGRGAMERSGISPCPPVPSPSASPSASPSTNHTAIPRRAHRVPDTQISQYPDSALDSVPDAHSNLPLRSNRNASPTPPPRPIPARPNLRRLTFIAPIALVLILVTGGILYFIPAIHNKFTPNDLAITVTLKPTHQLVQTPYSIPTNSVNTHQVTSSQSQTQSIQGTGHKQVAATQAKGTLTFLNGSFAKPFKIDAGTSIQGKDGISIATDSTVTIPLADPNIGDGQVNVSAHTILAGNQGNIVALDINQTCCAGGSLIFAKNTAAFTGGQDAQNYQFVQQADVQGATNPTIATLTQQAQSGLQARLNAGEQIVGAAQCTPNVSIDPQHPAGDTGVNVPATSATVTVQCRAEAYDGARLKNAVTQQFNTYVQKTHPDYTLVPQITPPTLQTANGQAVLVGNARGTWTYQMGDTQQRRLALSIAGLSVNAAMQKVRAATGIQDVTITGVDANGTLPGDATGIRIVVGT